MNADRCTDWLALVPQLAWEQRRQAFLMLALAEVNEDEAAAGASAPADEPTGLATRQSTAPGKQSTAVVALADYEATPAALAAAAQSRVARLGCPPCDANAVRPWGQASGLPRYRCCDCRRTFNALTGTSLARLRHKDRWAQQAQALMSGESLTQAATRCGVAATTAFRWRHRFLAAPTLDQPMRLRAMVEADETFILEAFKGRRSALPRAARKRGGKPQKTG